IRSSVDFPDPLRPMIPTNSPSRTLRSTPRTAATDTFERRCPAILPSTPLRGVRSVRWALYLIRTRCATTVRGDSSGATQSLSGRSSASSETVRSAEFAAIALLRSPEEDESADQESDSPENDDHPGHQARDLPVQERSAHHADQLVKGV